MTSKGIFDLSERVALVTAGGHGLGREYCLAMAEFGADVVCSDIDVGLAQETVELMRKSGHRAIAVQADVSNPEEVERMVAQTIAEFGTIDILFCNAGIANQQVPFHKLAVEDWDRVMAVNLRGTFLCMRAVLPIMLKQKKGSIICTASIAGLVQGGAPYAGPYGATKAGIISLSRHVAAEYAKDGIRINSIAPGLHDTKPVGLGLSIDEQEKIKSILSKTIPMGRFGEPSEIKGLAVYLASDASSYVTGQTFVEDGGVTAV